VEKMFDLGLVDEVRSLLKKKFSPTLNALNSVGYKEVISYLNGAADLFSCKEMIKQNSRRYAKRQLTWFRGEKDVEWIELADANALPGVADAVLKKLEIKKDE